jgi:hypothetical protein
MTQDETSGATANAYGHKTARLIAEKLGALPVSDGCNEFAYEGRLVTIRCARRTTTDVGVTYTMLDRVDGVIGAFEDDDAVYTLIEMTPSLYRMKMRDSKKEGKVGLVRRRTFEERGRILRTVPLK